MNPESGAINIIAQPGSVSDPWCECVRCDQDEEFGGEG